MKYEIKTEESNSTAKRNIHDKMVIYLVNAIICIVLTAALSFSFSFIMTNKSLDSIEGVWVRLPDDNPNANGMKVILRNAGGTYVGEVIEIDDDSTMPIGTNKWNNIQKDSRCVFKAQDMMMSANASERYYTDAYVLISLDGKTLTLYSPGAGYGRHQKWVKE